jgi:hypothetical protein
MTTATKPVTRAVKPHHAPHGVKPILAVTLFPDGTIEIREHGRRTGEVMLDLMTLYVRSHMRKAGL